MRHAVLRQLAAERVPTSVIDSSALGSNGCWVGRLTVGGLLFGGCAASDSGPAANATSVPVVIAEAPSAAPRDPDRLGPRERPAAACPIKALKLVARNGDGPVLSLDADGDIYHTAVPSKPRARLDPRGCVVHYDSQRVILDYGSPERIWTLHHPLYVSGNHFGPAKGSLYFFYEDGRVGDIHSAIDPDEFRVLPYEPEARCAATLLYLTYTYGSLRYMQEAPASSGAPTPSACADLY